MNKINQGLFSVEIGSRFGIDLKSIIQAENLSSFIKSSKMTTISLIKDLKKSTLEKIEQRIQAGIIGGLSNIDIQKSIQNVSKISDNRAKLIARNEISTFNANLSNERASRLGAEKGIWKTAQDARVRKCHQILQDKEFSIKTGIMSKNGMIKPAMEINCRCYTEYIYEDL